MYLWDADRCYPDRYFLVSFQQPLTFMLLISCLIRNQNKNIEYMFINVENQSWEKWQISIDKIKI